MATVTLKNLRGVDLTVRDREFVVLTGPAGCGSTAIIRAIAGLEEVSESEILFDDRRIDSVPARDRDVALLSHDYAPYPGMSVYQNLAIGLQRRKFAESEIKKRVDAVATELGFQGRLTAKASSLSAEEQRFVGLARVLVRQPRVYLFEEPFAGLDRPAALRGRSAIAALRQRSSATILYATSDPTEALGFGARTVIIDAGIVQQVAEGPAIFEAPANLMVAKFFGDPPMNLVKGALKQERDAIVFREAGDGTIAVRWPASDFQEGMEFGGSPVVLGFHSHALDIASSNKTGSSVFRALVDRAEPRGAGTDLYLRTGEHELICRSQRRGEGDLAGHRFEFEIDPAKAHLFDAASGRVLT
jgi:multiple sugar transport system ATP-binding protein